MTGMADFEAENFEAALRHVVQKFTEDHGPFQHADIMQFLELELCFLDGLPCIKGDYGTLLKFTHMIIQTGIEKMFAFCG